MRSETAAVGRHERRPAEAGLVEGGGSSRQQRPQGAFARPVEEGSLVCRLCGNTGLEPVLDLGSQALTGHFPAAGEPDPPHAPLRLVACRGADDACGLLQLGDRLDAAALYGAHYGYRSAVTRTMRDHLGAKARALQAMVALTAGDTILDIGCNDGTLLRAYETEGVRLFGADPSSGPLLDQFPAGARVLVDFFTADALRPMLDGTQPKIITAIAMFYDLDEPLAFMRDIKALLARDGVAEIEQCHFPTAIERLTYDTICHEHVTYYGLAQMEWLAARAGLVIVDAGVNEINGGSFWVRLAHDDGPFAARKARLAHLRRREAGQAGGPAGQHRFAQRVAAHREIVRAFFADCAVRGERVLGLGASTKGNVLLQYCGLTAREMPAVIERYAGKVGRRTPGSGIAIIDEAVGRAMRPDHLFVLPWHFRDEIIAREEAYLEGGGRLVFPLPDFEIVGTGGKVLRRHPVPDHSLR